MSFMVMHDIDVADFEKTLDSCKGDVYLETSEGDVLNLKSKLERKKTQFANCV